MNDNLFINVRAVKIPAIQIRQVEDEYGVKLVPDTEPEILLTLDNILQRYRLANSGKDPEYVMIAEYPEYLFKHMTLNINVMGLQLPGSQNKPCWFRTKRIF